MEWMRDRSAQREFETFVAGATDYLFRTAVLMTTDAGDAEDLVQETFIKMAGRWDRIRRLDRPLAYGRRVLVNLAIDGHRRRGRRRDELWLRDGPPDYPDESAAGILAGVDDMAEFRWALGQVPPHQRAVLVLRYWHDLPVAEVADLLGCSPGTVKSAASRGAARLAQLLTEARATAQSVALANGQIETASATEGRPS